jgi:hypothetical protein
MKSLALSNIECEIDFGYENVLQIKPRTLAAAQPSSHLVKSLGHGYMMTLHTLGEKQPIT